MKSLLKTALLVTVTFLASMVATHHYMVSTGKIPWMVYSACLEGHQPKGGLDLDEMVYCHNMGAEAWKIEFGE